MGTMYLPMERSKHSIIVSEPTLLGTKNRKQTKVVFFFYVQAGGVIQCSILYS